MLLIHCTKVTPRIDYTFKHICTRILGLKIGFTGTVEEFINHQGPKLSYGRQPMGNEMFFQSHGLLESNGIEDLNIQVQEWGHTVGFFAVGDKSSFPYDIFSAAFYLLSRYEEYLPYFKDELGRFPASESLAFRHGFLNKPVIDQWAYLLKEKLLASFPQMVFPQRLPTIHSLMKIEQPYQFKKKGAIRSLMAFGAELGRFKFRTFGKRFKVLFGGSEDPLDVYPWLVEQLKKNKNPFTSFFLMGEHPNFGQGFNTSRNYFIALLKFMSDYREVGLLFSKNALYSEATLKDEIERMEEFILRSVRSTTNFDFTVALPDPYRNLVEQEIARDFSMVYEDQVGFRASTCSPFLFYDLDFEIKTPLLIHPIAFATSAFNQRYESDSLERIQEMLTLVSQLNGTFSVFFDNSDFTDTKSNQLWRNLFSEILHPDET